MLSGASAKPNSFFKSALTQPILGLSTKIQAIAINRPGIAKESSARLWNSAAPGASVRSTAQETSPPSASVVSAVPIAKTSELRNSAKISQLEYASTKFESEKAPGPKPVSSVKAL